MIIKKGSLASSNVAWTSLASVSVSYSILALSDVSLLSVQGYQVFVLEDAVVVAELLELISTKYVAEVATFGDEIVIDFVKALVDSTSILDVPILLVSKVVSESIVFSDAVEIIMVFNRLDIFNGSPLGSNSFG